MNNDDPLETYPDYSSGFQQPSPNLPQLAQRPTYTTMSATIETFVITDAGNYNNQVIRPHVTVSNGDILNQFVHNIQGAVSRQSKITPTLLGGSLGNIIYPSTTPEPSIAVPNGWGTNRLRFFLKVRIMSAMSNPRIAYFQGYTEYSDQSLSGQIDPNMIFFINSFAVVEESQVDTPNGNFVLPKLIESSNILPPISNAPGPFATQQVNPNMGFTDIVRPLTYIRPNDVFSSMQVNHISENIGGASYDMRIDPNTHIKSWKSNNNTGAYMANILNNYIESTVVNRNHTGMHAYDDMSTVLESSINSAEENPLTDNPFLRELAKAYGASFRAVTHFSLKTLLDLDRDLHHKIRYLRPTPKMMTNIPQAGNSEYWTSQTREVVAATLIMNSLSSILFENMISNVSLVSTNMTVGGQVVTSYSNALSLTGVDASAYLQTIIFRLEKEILSSISFNNEDSFKIVVDMDLFGFTNISLSLSGGPMVPFVAPTFADSLFSPIVTHQPMLKNNLVKDIEFALDSVSSAIHRPVHPVSTGSSIDSTQYNF